MQVIGLVLIIEALMPFISPRSYRSMALRMAGTPDKTLRLVALITLGFGVVLLSLAHY
ncbi:MAG TPA: DUF2065 domain-containing protein [Halothiobacillus sp.]|nr:DUF2065 domain-containing protein [Halothiobacillus sp.]